MSYTSTGFFVDGTSVEIKLRVILGGLKYGILLQSPESTTIHVSQLETWFKREIAAGEHQPLTEMSSYTLVPLQAFIERHNEGV